jgi:predicted TIM-barrel fold metal-dependent hydrolase
MRNAPRQFLNLYMPDTLANVIEKATNTKLGVWIIGNLLRYMGGNAGRRYASFLQIGKSASQLDVFETLMAQYDDPNTKFAALTMYMEKCGADFTESGFDGQLQEAMEVKRRYPDNLLLFMGIDPRWKYSSTELRKTVQSYFEKKVTINAIRSVYPFVGLKIYPSMGFYAFDAKLKETFDWAADNGVPVISHCKYLGGIYTNDTSYIKSNLNPYDPYSKKLYNENFGSKPPVYYEEKSFSRKLFGTDDNKNNLHTCSYFLEPVSYRTMVEYFAKRPNPLKLSLAHYGGSDQILIEYRMQTMKKQQYGMLPAQNWCAQIKDLMSIYPNVYTDISYSLANRNTHSFILDDLDNKIYGRRIMFGTDFFLTEREMPEHKDVALFKVDALAKRLTNYNNITAWEQIACHNTTNFLKSRFYDGSVI